MLIGISITLSLILLSIPQFTHAALIDDIARGVHCTVRTLLGDTTCTIPLTTATTLNAFTQPQQSPPQPTTTTIIKPVERVVHTREVVREAPTLAYAQLATVLATIHDDVADIQVRTNDVIKEYQHTRFGDDALWRAVAHSQRIDQLSGDGLTISGLDCSTYANGGTLTTDNNGTVVCAADDNTTVPNTDNQTIDTFTFSGDTISLSLEDDGEAVKTIDLSTYTNDTDINTQAALEAFITDVTNVFTNTDTITDTNISDTLTIGSSSTVADGALSANVSLLGQSIDISDETNLTAGTNLTLTDDTLSVDDAFLSNTGDTATGDYNFDSNTLFIDSSTNRVGVGTGGPGAALEIASGNIEVGDDFHIYNDAVGSSGSEYGLTWAVTTQSGFANRLQLKAPTGVDVLIDSNNSQTTTAFTVGHNDVTVDGGNYAEVFRVQENGNVGIGTTSPEALLNLSSTAPSLFFDDSNGTAAASRTQFIQDNDQFLVKLRNRDTNALVSNVWVVDYDGTDIDYQSFYTGTSERMRIDSSGNVGVGTTNPIARLDVRQSTGTAGDIMHLRDTVDGRDLYFHYDGDTHQIRSEANGAGLSFLAFADPSGNVGIGETSPAQLLDVDGIAQVDHINIEGGAGSYIGGNLYYNSGWKYSSTADGAFVIRNSGDGIQFYTAPGNGTVGGDATVTERMRIKEDGNVGIGTTSPVSPLHVAAPTYTATSSTQFASRITVTANPASASTGASYGHYNYSNKIGDQSLTTVVAGYDLADNNGSGAIANLYSSSVVARNNGSGSVTNMRGVTSHAYNNSTGSVTNAYGLYGTASNYNASGVVTNAYGGFFDTYLAAGTITNGYGVFITDIEGTNQFGLYQSSSTDKNYFAGNVGIGTTVPDTTLHVDGADMTSFMGTGEGTMKIDAPYGASGDQYRSLDFTHNGGSPYTRIASKNNGSGSYLQFGTSNSYVSGITNTAVTIDPNGRVGIGDTTPDAALDVVGDIHYTGTITDVSDERLKNNITTLTYGLDELLQLQPISFTMLDNASSTPQLGFTAQNVNDLFPEAVSEIDDGFLGLDYTQLIAPLVNGVREVWEYVTDKFSEHDARLASLEAEVAALQTQLASVNATHTPTVSDDEDEPFVLTVEITGANPAEIALGSAYSDLGATARSPEGGDLSIMTFIDGVEVDDVALDTATSTTYTIDYVAEYNDVRATSTRTVIIGEIDEEDSEEVVVEGETETADENEEAVDENSTDEDVPLGDEEIVDETAVQDELPEENPDIVEENEEDEAVSTNES